VFSLLKLGAQSVQRIDSFLKLLQKGGHDTVRAKLLNRIAGNYENLGLYDSTYKYAKMSHAISNRVNYINGITNSSNLMAHYFISNGSYDSAYRYYDICMYHYKLANDKEGMAGLYNNLGVLYKRKGNTSKALDYYYKSLKLKEEIGDSLGMGNSCSNLGSLYVDNGDTVNGLKYNLRALRIREQIRDRSGMASSYMALGLYYSKLPDFINAEINFRKALRIEEELGDEEGIAIASYNIGGFYFKQKKFTEAEKLFQRALDISIKNSDPEGLAVCYKSLGEIKYLKGMKKEALQYYENSYKAARESNSIEIIYPAAEELSKLYEELGDYKKALAMQRESILLKDSVFNTENLKKLASTELKYQHEKETLLLQNEQQKREALAEAENHKKNIIIICSALFLIAVGFFAFILYKRLQENKKQKYVIEQQNKEIVDSIKYAQRIQNTLLTGESFISEHVSENFILFKPKDIVSGDFYWGTVSQHPTLNTQLFYLAVCDSTGHGVPGAFMSLLNIGFLNEAVNEKSISDPDKVFNYTREKLINSISKEGQKDGFDGILLRIEKNNDGAKVHYAAANNKSIVISDGKLVELKNDRMPVGKGEKEDSFSLYEISLKKGDIIYMFTDGFADQFGGLEGKKFKYKQLNELLLHCSREEMSKQKNMLETEFTIWKNNLEQVDDVCVIGIKV
jgi:tetratricopeptide (TPR) repeat protein